LAEKEEWRGKKSTAAPYPLRLPASGPALANYCLRRMLAKEKVPMELVLFVMAVVTVSILFPFWDTTMWLVPAEMTVAPALMKVAPTHLPPV
jgi:hypothetical protein